MTTTKSTPAKQELMTRSEAMQDALYLNYKIESLVNVLKEDHNHRGNQIAIADWYMLISMIHDFALEQKGLLDDVYAEENNIEEVNNETA